MNIYEQAELELATALGWSNVTLVEGIDLIRTPSLMGTHPNGKMFSDVPAYARSPFQTATLIAEYELDITWTFDAVGHLQVSVYNSDFDPTVTEKVKDHMDKRRCVAYAVAKVVNLLVIAKKNVKS